MRFRHHVCVHYEEDQQRHVCVWLWIEPGTVTHAHMNNVVIHISRLSVYYTLLEKKLCEIGSIVHANCWIHYILLDCILWLWNCINGVDFATVPFELAAKPSVLNQHSTPQSFRKHFCWKDFLLDSWIFSMVHQNTCKFRLVLSLITSYFACDDRKQIQMKVILASLWKLTAASKHLLLETMQGCCQLYCCLLLSSVSILNKNVLYVTPGLLLGCSPQLPAPLVKCVSPGRFLEMPLPPVAWGDPTCQYCQKFFKEKCYYASLGLTKLEVEKSLLLWYQHFSTYVGACRPISINVHTTMALLAEIDIGLNTGKNIQKLEISKVPYMSVF